ncbi:MAG TPA: A/G-specific adenine glycosylase [Flavisolibacter sp.]|jgi:A/G-specific adenine glycosylase|nr:A/G-specific adenine glycosylase [Flavisolibacter sp.]
MNKKENTKSAQKNRSTEELGKLFVEKLLVWSKNENKRQMPWKGEKDPYRIWLSEIILQQTRVEQGLNYYENFIKTFPNVHELANAQEEKVFKLWEGLGYYSRCRNLIAAAKVISKDLKGIFPKDFDSILELKGVGNYTASAIASFAYNLPYAVLDGNVFRVLSRVFNIETAVDSINGKKYFAELAQLILPKNDAAKYNQAIMDFGAVVCKPYPECKICFFNKHCNAYLHGTQDLLPVKEKKIKIRERWLNYFLVIYKDEILVRQRTTKDIWQNLFELLLIETGQNISPKKLALLFARQYGLTDFVVSGHEIKQQKLTHQLINFCILKVEINKKQSVADFFWTKISDLDQYAFPKTLQEAVRNI